MRKNWPIFLTIILACLFVKAELQDILPGNIVLDTSYISDYQRKAVENYIENAANSQSGLPNQINNFVPTPSVRTIHLNKKLSPSHGFVVLKRLSTNFGFFSHKVSSMVCRFSSSSDFYVVMFRHLII